jgi:hypothetical protein
LEWGSRCQYPSCTPSLSSPMSARLLAREL